MHGSVLSETKLFTMCIGFMKHQSEINIKCEVKEKWQNKFVLSCVPVWNFGIKYKKFSCMQTENLHIVLSL